MKLTDRNRTVFELVNSLKTLDLYDEIYMLGLIISDDHVSIRMSYILMTKDIEVPRIKELVTKLEELNKIELNGE